MQKEKALGKLVLSWKNGENQQFLSRSNLSPIANYSLNDPECLSVDLSKY